MAYPAMHMMMPPQMSPLQEFIMIVQTNRTELHNSIAQLTQLASLCYDQAKEIVEFISKEMNNAFGIPQRKFQLMLLIDSIFKNVQGRYLELFKVNIFNQFEETFKLV